MLLFVVLGECFVEWLCVVIVAFLLCGLSCSCLVGCTLCWVCGLVLVWCWFGCYLVLYLVGLVVSFVDLDTGFIASGLGLWLVKLVVLNCLVVLVCVLFVFCLGFGVYCFGSS